MVSISGIVYVQIKHFCSDWETVVQDQLNRILASEIFHEPNDRWDHRQWVFLLGLLQGLRLNSRVAVCIGR